MTSTTTTTIVRDCDICGLELSSSESSGRNQMPKCGNCQQTPRVCAACFDLYINKEMDKIVEKRQQGDVNAEKVVNCFAFGCKHTLPLYRFVSRLRSNPVHNEALQRLRDIENSRECCACLEFKLSGLRCCRGNFCKECVTRLVRGQIEDSKLLLGCPSCKNGFSSQDLIHIIGYKEAYAFERKKTESYQKRVVQVVQDGGASSKWVQHHCRQCPRCKVLIEKNDGCNDMHCRCGINFCYGCGCPHTHCACAKLSSADHQSILMRQLRQSVVYCWNCMSDAHSSEKCPRDEEARKRFQREKQRETFSKTKTKTQTPAPAVITTATTPNKSSRKVAKDIGDGWFVMTKH